MVDGFCKTPARVDEYFALKKVEADWALEWARPAGLRASGRPAWALSSPFQLHLSRAGSSLYSNEEFSLPNIDGASNSEMKNTDMIIARN